MSDLTARIRAKLDEVNHAADCASRFGVGLARWTVHRLSSTASCTCDHPQRVADLVRRMIEATQIEAVARFIGVVEGVRLYDSTVQAACEAALAVPSEEEERG